MIHPVTGCYNAFNSDPCDDGKAGTIADHYVQGTCHGTPDYARCDDGTPGTTDTLDLVDGTCTHVFNTATCDDGDAATANDVFDGAGHCVGILIVCDDSNPLTVDEAVHFVGCRHTPVADGTPCDDQNPVTFNDHAESGLCIGTPSQPPGAPSVTSTSGGNHRVSVEWLAPANPGTAPITGYRVNAGTASVVVGATAKAAVITGLANGVQVSVTVTAISDHGSTTSLAATATPGVRPVTFLSTTIPQAVIDEGAAAVAGVEAAGATNFSWDFDGDGTTDLSGPNAHHVSLPARSGPSIVHAVLTATNDDGGSATLDVNYAVRNIAPNVTNAIFTGNAASIGLPVTLSVAGATDVFDTLQYRIWCGTKTEATPPPGGNSRACTYPTAGTFNAKVEVRDDVDVKVLHLAVLVRPVLRVSITGPASLIEGQFGTWTAVVAGAATPLTSLRYQWQANVAGAAKTVTLAAGDDENGPLVISLVVTDAANRSATASLSVVVKNRKPTGSLAAAPIGTPTHSAVATVSNVDDISPDDLENVQVRFDCGDGKGWSAWSASQTRNCTYKRAGSFRVLAQLRDDEMAAGAIAAANIVASVTVS